MANQEHLKILGQGVEIWNKWREANPDIVPDLKEAELNGMNLNHVNLSGAILKGADFSRAEMYRANLHKADLTEADLCEAHLLKANLSETVLIEAGFEATDLRNVNLRAADLKDVSLETANLVCADLSKANLTGAALYGIARDDWIIDGIKCDFVYLDFGGSKRTPKDRFFNPGEFEKLFKSLPTFEYAFEKTVTPLDAVLMDKIIQSINEMHPEFELKLDRFQAGSTPKVVFTVNHKKNAEKALEQISAEYEKEIAIISAKYDSVSECYKQIVGSLKMGDIYNIKGQVGAVGPGAQAKDINFTQVWQEVSDNIDLTKLASELAKIRSALKIEPESAENDIATGEVASAEIAAQEGRGAKVLEHLKKAGKCILGISEKIGTVIVTELVKKSMGI